jgi:hypothetical protein
MGSGYLIDTNAISELRRRQPEPRVVEWFERRPARVLYLSVLSLGEIRRGIERLEEGRRAQALRHWLEDELPAWFRGRPLPAIDSLLAGLPVALVNPWDGEAEPKPSPP